MYPQKPTLFGYGLTTKAIANKLGGGCTFFDDKTTQSFNDDNGNTIHPSSHFDPTKSTLEVTTPSLKPTHPLIQSANNLLSEYDYFSTQMPFSIWISGTNGKTTTTQMLTHLLAKRGAVSGGNIGTPLADLSLDAPIWVLESSSFTLHHTKIASPNIYLLLPITPDHLDWHEDATHYTNDKLRPLLTMKEGELALVPKGLNLPKTDAYVVEYESDDFICEYFKLDASKVKFKGAFLQDALLALAISRVLFDEADYTQMNSFTRDSHRQEEFYDSAKRLWVNDSKATNLDATIQAVKSYSDKPLHLIIGGEDKEVDLTPLFEILKPLDITLYPIGKNSQRLLDLAHQNSIHAIEAKHIDQAISTIDKVHTTKSVALLSPAAASFDQFNSYKHRGEYFINGVKNL